MKEKILNFRYAFFREKYRFDQGNAFLVFLNFSLLVVSLVKQSQGNISMIYWYVMLGFMGTWVLGFFLDRVVKVQDAQERIAVKRSPIWKENFTHHNEIDQKVGHLVKKVEKIEKILERKL